MFSCWWRASIFHLFLDFPAFIGRYTGPHGPSTFPTAQAHCQSIGQKLMTIDSPEEENHLTSVLNPTFQYVWNFKDFERSSSTALLAATIANSAVQKSGRTFFHNTIFFIETFQQCLTETPLDRDSLPRQRPPAIFLGETTLHPNRNLQKEHGARHRDPLPRRNIGPGSQTGSDIITKTPPNGQNDWHTCVKILRAVIRAPYLVIIASNQFNFLTAPFQSTSWNHRRWDWVCLEDARRVHLSLVQLGVHWTKR